MTTMIDMRATTLGTESFITGSTRRTSVRTRKASTVGPSTAPTITTVDTHIVSSTKTIQVRATIIRGGVASEVWPQDFGLDMLTPKRRFRGRARLRCVPIGDGVLGALTSPARRVSLQTRATGSHMAPRLLVRR